VKPLNLSVSARFGRILQYCGLFAFVLGMRVITRGCSSLPVRCSGQGEDNGH